MGGAWAYDDVQFAEDFPIGDDLVLLVNRVQPVDDSGLPLRGPNGKLPVVDATPIPICGCEVQPVRSDEHETNKDFVDLLIKVFLPGCPPITATSALLWRGESYEVQGDELFFERDHVAVLARHRKG